MALPGEATLGLLDSLVDRLQAALVRPRAARSWRCGCGAQIYFGNSQCLSCGGALGFDPEHGQLLRLPAFALDGQPLQRCANLHLAGCNWLLPAGDMAPQGGLCRACRLNRTVPDLSVPGNAQAWAKSEAAKRRLVAQLLTLGLPVRSRLTEDPHSGVMFDFLQPLQGTPVQTGHLHGLITLNIEEADDARREALRLALREPYRTLLGHLRHEMGHYYWDRLVAGTGWLTLFRNRFGDERQDYAAALQHHHGFGPAPNWSQHCISAYASSHPWEDWAESFAHYLHMIDTVETALSYGLTADEVEMAVQPFAADALDSPDDAPRFLQLINGWVELTAVLNELSQSMGQPPFYPFVLNAPAVAKLHLVHRVVSGV
jgi:hypothetical protein